MKINSNNNKRCQLYLNQEKKVNIHYSDKKKTFKNYIDEKTSEFKEKYSNFKLFCNIIHQSRENIKKNYETMEKIISNFTPAISEKDSYMSDLEQFLTNQKDGEKEKYERIDLPPEYIKGNIEFEKKGKEMINILNKYLNEYNSLIDKLNLSHINYLKYFNDYEVKMIKDET